MRRRLVRRTSRWWYRKTARYRTKGIPVSWAWMGLSLGLTVVTFLATHPGIFIGLGIVAACLGAVFLLVKTKEHRNRKLHSQTGVAFRGMTPGQFEHALADLCRRDGCRNVRVVGGAGDLAADVLATTPDGRRILVQAKRYAPRNNVGSPEVQKVGGTYSVVHGADLAVVVTTSGFTAGAIKYARIAKIRLYDEHALAAWASRTGPAPWQ